MPSKVMARPNAVFPSGGPPSRQHVAVPEMHPSKNRPWNRAILPSGTRRDRNAFIKPKGKTQEARTTSGEPSPVAGRYRSGVVGPKTAYGHSRPPQEVRSSGDRLVPEMTRVGGATRRHGRVR